MSDNRATAAVSALTDHLGFWLRVVSNHVSHSFAAKLEEKGVTVAEWCLMRGLYGREPAAPSRMADDLGLTKGAITRLADRLIVKSMVRREASETDGRAQTLALTELGDALVPELAALADLNDAQWFGSLDPDERGRLTHVLKGLAERAHMAPIAVD